MGAPWAVSGHIHVGGLTNPCQPGAENVEAVIVNTGGHPLPEKRAPTKNCEVKFKNRNSTHAHTHTI